MSTSTSTSSAESDDDDLDLLEYLHKYGLARNFLDDDLSIELQQIKASVEPLSDIKTEETQIFRCTPQILEPEKLAIKSSDYNFLIDQIREKSPSPDLDLAQLEPSVQRHQAIKVLKVELPLLETDHELDLLRFKQRSAGGPLDDYALILRSRLKLHTNDESDLSTDPDQDFHSYAEKLEYETLRTTKGSIQLLHSVIAPKNIIDEYDEPFLAMAAKRKVQLQLTPPLSARKSSPILAGLPLPTNFVGEIDGEIDTDTELGDVGSEVDLNEKIHSNPLATDESFNTERLRGSEGFKRLLGSDILDKSDLHVGSPHCPKEDFTLDSPLLPTELFHKHPFLGESSLAPLVDPSTELKTTQPEQSSGSPTDLIKGIEALATCSTIKVENEQSRVADSDLRIELPLDETFPPCIPRCHELPALPDDSTIYRGWTETSIPEIALSWTPITSQRINKTSAYERIDHLTILNDILGDADEFVMSDDQIEKSQGLRILETDKCNEEDIQPHDPGLQEERPHNLVQQDIHAPMMPPELSNLLDTKKQSSKKRSKAYMGFSMATNLDLLVRMNGDTPSKRLKVADEREAMQAELPPTGLRRPKLHQFMIFRATQPPADPSSRQYIISVELLQHRRPFIQEMWKLYPNAVYIEREYSVLQIRHPVRSLGESPPEWLQDDPSLEADITVSPSTGIMLTNLQRIRQESLPGEGPTRNLFHERLMKTSLRYEMIIVLVSQGFEQVFKRAQPPGLLAVDTNQNQELTEPAPALTERDCNAIAAVQIAGSALPANVLVNFIPGGDAELAAAATRHMKNHGIEDIVLRSDESVWEQFLRRAGFNTFAAQWILFILNGIGARRDPKSSRVDYGSGEALMESNSSSDLNIEPLGLKDFCLMSAEQRLALFSQCFCGHTVLNRVNRMLESGWRSESLGSLPLLQFNTPQKPSHLSFD